MRIFHRNESYQLAPLLPLSPLFFGRRKEAKWAALISMKRSQFYRTLRYLILHGLQEKSQGFLEKSLKGFWLKIPAASLIQVEALKQMLNFNDVGGGSGGKRDSFYGSGSTSGESALMSSEPKWKVLVYDAVGQAILAPIFSVKQLRDSGVTLHILIDSQR